MEGGGGLTAPSLFLVNRLSNHFVSFGSREENVDNIGHLHSLGEKRGHCKSSHSSTIGWCVVDCPYHMDVCDLLK